VQDVFSDTYFKAATLLPACLYVNQARYERKVAAGTTTAAFDQLATNDQKKIIAGMHMSILRSCGLTRNEVKLADGWDALELLGPKNYWPASAAFLESRGNSACAVHGSDSAAENSAAGTSEQVGGASDPAQQQAAASALRVWKQGDFLVFAAAVADVVAVDHAETVCSCGCQPLGDKSALMLPIVA
jgi:hypothetical protein